MCGHCVAPPVFRIGLVVAGSQGDPSGSFKSELLFDGGRFAKVVLPDLINDVSILNNLDVVDGALAEAFSFYDYGKRSRSRKLKIGTNGCIIGSERE